MNDEIKRTKGDAVWTIASILVILAVIFFVGRWTAPAPVAVPKTDQEIRTRELNRRVGLIELALRDIANRRCEAKGGETRYDVERTDSFLCTIGKDVYHQDQFFRWISEKTEIKSF